MSNTFTLVIRSHADPDYRHVISANAPTRGSLNRVEDGANINLNHEEFYTCAECLSDDLPLCDKIIIVNGVVSGCDNPAPHCVGGELYFCDDHWREQLMDEGCPICGQVLGTSAGLPSCGQCGPVEDFEL